MESETQKAFADNEAALAELRELVKDRLNWYTRSGRTPTLHSSVWIERARKALGYSEGASLER